MEFISRNNYFSNDALPQSDILILSGGRELSIAKGFKFGPYTSDFYDFVYCKHGAIDLYLNDKLVKINGDTLFVIPPFTKVEKFFREEYSGIFVIVTGEQIKGYLSLLGISEEDIIFPHTVPQKSIEQLEQILDLLDTYGQTTVSTPDEVVQPKYIVAPTHNAMERKIRRTGLFHLFISDLLSLLPASDESAIPKLPKETREKYVNAAIKYIEENYNFDISVDAVTKAVGLNRSYLYSLFQEYLGYSVQEFIIRTRINAACKLLCRYNIPIKTIAASIKYDPVTFSHIFKKITGMTAKEYRMRYKDPPYAVPENEMEIK